MLNPYHAQGPVWCRPYPLSIELSSSTQLNPPNLLPPGILHLPFPLPEMCHPPSPHTHPDLGKTGSWPSGRSSKCHLLRKMPYWIRRSKWALLLPGHSLSHHPISMPSCSLLLSESTFAFIGFFSTTEHQIEVSTQTPRDNGCEISKLVIPPWNPQRKWSRIFPRLLSPSARSSI